MDSLIIKNMYVCTDVCTDVCMYVCIYYVCTDVCTGVCTDICMYESCGLGLPKLSCKLARLLHSEVM